MTQHTFTLTVSCADQSGIIAALTGCIAETGGNILNLAQHTAVDIGMFLPRLLRRNRRLHRSALPRSLRQNRRQILDGLAVLR